MKKLDKDGLLLCSIQGEVFAASLDYSSSSSEIFMRRFMTSELSKEFDQLAILNSTFTTKDAFDSLNSEFGETSYGKVRYNREVLFWIGYLYRYMAYTYDLSSKYIYKIIKPKELNVLYYVYHTFDCSQAIERILEDKNISFDYEKQNQELLKLMRTKKYIKETSIAPIVQKSTEDASIDNKTLLPQYERKVLRVALALLYKEEAIGEITFRRHDTGVYKLELSTLDKFRNEELFSIAIQKAIEYAKIAFGSQTILVEIIKTSTETVLLFQKLGFVYTNENDKYVYYLYHL